LNDGVTIVERWLNSGRTIVDVTKRFNHEDHEEVTKFAKQPLEGKRSLRPHNHLVYFVQALRALC